jgi:hypothetical protein
MHASASARSYQQCPIGPTYSPLQFPLLDSGWIPTLFCLGLPEPMPGNTSRWSGGLANCGQSILSTFAVSRLQTSRPTRCRRVVCLTACLPTCTYSHGSSNHAGSHNCTASCPRPKYFRPVSKDWPLWVTGTRFSDRPSVGFPPQGASRSTRRLFKALDSARRPTGPFFRSQALANFKGGRRSCARRKPRQKVGDFRSSPRGGSWARYARQFSLSHTRPRPTRRHAVLRSPVRTQDQDQREAWQRCLCAGLQ